MTLDTALATVSGGGSPLERRPGCGVVRVSEGVDGPVVTLLPVAGVTGWPLAIVTSRMQSSILRAGPIAGSGGEDRKGCLFVFSLDVCFFFFPLREFSLPLRNQSLASYLFLPSRPLFLLTWRLCPCWLGVLAFLLSPPVGFSFGICLCWPQSAPGICTLAPVGLWSWYCISRPSRLSGFWHFSSRPSGLSSWYFFSRPGRLNFLVFIFP